MRLRQIEVFDAVYSTGSVTRAAERLCVSQPSVSKVLAHAEQQLGYRLFDRVKGRLVPTAEADQLYAHVRSVNMKVDQLRKIARNLVSADVGTIRIAATPAFGLRFLPRVIAAWRKAHPATFFSLFTRHHNEIIRGLLESRYDLGLAFEPQATPGLHGEILTRGRMMVLARRDLEGALREGQGDTLSLATLSEQPFIDLDQRGPLGELLARRIGESTISLNRVAEVETYHVARALVEEGVGVTITDEITARSGTATTLFSAALEPPCEYNISALYPDEAPPGRTLATFLAFLRGELERYLEKG